LIDLRIEFIHFLSEFAHHHFPHNKNIHEATVKRTQDLICQQPKSHTTVDE